MLWTHGSPVVAFGLAAVMMVIGALALLLVP